jgi:hypothetical protein
MNSPSRVANGQASINRQKRATLAKLLSNGMSPRRMRTTRTHVIHIIPITARMAEAIALRVLRTTWGRAGILAILTQIKTTGTTTCGSTDDVLP